MNADHWSPQAKSPGIVKKTVYYWRQRQGPPAHEAGHLWKHQLSEADAWLRAGGADEESGGAVLHANNKQGEQV